MAIPGESTKARRGCDGPSGTDEEGFEPSIQVSPYAGLANRCLQPLGHPSMTLRVAGPALNVTRRGPSRQPVRRDGQGGIRTHGTVAGTAVFKTAALNRSATCP